MNSEVKVNRTTVKNKKKEADLTCNKFDNSNWTAFWEAVKKKVPFYTSIMNTKKREVVFNVMPNCSVQEVSDALVKATKAKKFFFISIRTIFEKSIKISIWV